MAVNRFNQVDPSSTYSFSSTNNFIHNLQSLVYHKIEQFNLGLSVNLLAQKPLRY